MGACHVHITGASGSGVTTLGKMLAQQHEYEHFDTDDFYWLPTNPPFQQKREVSERLRLLEVELDRSRQWVLSGSLTKWGDPLIERFDLVVFLYVPPKERLKRLTSREQERFGSAIHKGGTMYQQHLEFLEWARSYDSGPIGGRSLAGHNSWLSALRCPVVRIEGDFSPEQVLSTTLEAMGGVP